MPASKYTEAQRAEALALYETDGPTAAGAQLGIPKETIMSWARRTGVHTVRTAKTNAATEAKQADDKAVRAIVASNALNVAKLATQILQGRLTDNPDEIPVKDLATIAGIFTDKHVVLAKLDQDSDTTASDSVVDQLLEGFRKQAGR